MPASTQGAKGLVVAERPARLFYGWAIVANAVLLSFVQTATFNPILSVFMKPMSEELGWSRAAISGAVSVGSVVGGLLSLAVGPIVDRRGARLVLVCSVTALGASLLLLSHFVALWQFYLVFGIGRAMSVGIIEVTTLVAVSNWFVRKRGRALGMVTTGTRIGQGVLPLLVQLLIVAWGWRSGWLSLGVMVLALSVIPTVLVMRRKPEDLGLLPDGQPATSADKRPKEPAWRAKEAVRTSTFWLIVSAYALSFMATGGINLHQLPHLTDVGISPQVAVGAVAVFATFGAIGAMLWPLLAERVDVRYCLVAALISSILGVVLLMFVRGAPMAYVYAVVYGFSFGGLFPLYGMALANYFGRASQGSIRGAAHPVLMLANATGPLLAGIIYDLRSSYQLAFGLFIGAYVLALVWVLLARPPAARREAAAVSA